MKNKYIILAALTGVLSTTACKKQLEEKAYSVLLTDNFYNSKTEVISALLRPYTHANAWATPSGQDGWWRQAELSGDQLAWPTKGRHGEDGGKWKRLHYHTWTVDEPGFNQAWKLIYTGIGYCNDPIENIGKRDIAQMGITQAEKDAYIAELKILRAFHYLKLLDLFGNVPVVTQVGVPLQPETVPRAEVFAFVEKEIKENIDLVPKLSMDQLGRMSQASAYAMLVELYLNAEVWTGTAKWAECEKAATDLINNIGGGQNGAMSLDPNITDQFKPTNQLSKEVIFSIAYDFSTAGFEPSWTGEFYHFNQREIYGGGRNGNDGIVVIPGVYDTYDSNDLRRSTWLLIGPQFRFVDPTQPVLATEEYRDKPLVFVDNIRRNSTGGTTSNMSEGEENSGVRFNKYKLGNQLAGPGIPADPNYNNTDWNIYRLTWIYFAKAEAIMRQNGGNANAEAVQLINDCKRRAFTAANFVPYTTATLTLTELLAERGREFIFEGFRRDDLIRFGRFTTGSWWDHNPTSANKALYPIPQVQRDLNPKLRQNPL
ncbi:RagB/SusD family nutrient uptake outer membrane protein [Mucilaginibacter myungsuensis]|uniref:RagB/SusD family nutrient uptake outer membrane protein n=1 Tax=Mucilaginibacter myungsuensis TaxID=649104 RepID=A0A929PYQ1_9SPHI|nr:RagB/SusD family nutrient uptake outer membrane protein [Mucilaginibacter myungsuensis]MBE9664399.1 RagB/SusD family nutrient uptake outer membrane protein [Mucilaginibacter myungsuensis]MDN3597110.1 RagB/SusD family nutrient uptake outer membrane protein [Mucilaginibacter myungsuensis]